MITYVEAMTRAIEELKKASSALTSEYADQHFRASDHWLSIAQELKEYES